MIASILQEIRRSRDILSDRWVLAALIAGVSLRFCRLGSAPLWFDEVITADWVGRSWLELFSLCLADNHPPLYFIITKAWIEIFPFSAWIVRVPSAVVGAAATPLAALAAAALADDRRFARWAAWLAALSPFLIHHSQEARMYSLLGALAAANLLALIRFTKGSSEKLSALFIGTAVGLVATHYYSVFYLGGATLAAILARPRAVRAWLPGTAAVAASSVVALIAAAILARHEAGGSYELRWFAFPGVLWSLVTGYTLLPDTFALHAEGGRAAIRYLPVALGAAPALAVCVLSGIGALDRRGRLALLMPLATTIGGPFAVWLAMDGPVNPRYFQAGAPALLTLLATGAAAGSARRLRRAAGVVVVVLFMAGAALHLKEPGHGREDLNAATAWIEANVPQGQPLLVTSSEMSYLARFHWPSRAIVDYPNPQTEIDPLGARNVARLLPWHGGRTFYVFGRTWVSDPEAVLESEVRRGFSSCGFFKALGVRIYCLIQPDGTGTPGEGGA